MITVLAGALWTEVLRYAYALSTGRGPEGLAAVILAALVVGFALVGWKLRASGPPRVDGGAPRRRRLTTGAGGFDRPVVGGYRRV